MAKNNNGKDAYFERSLKKASIYKFLLGQECVCVVRLILSSTVSYTNSVG